MKKTLIALALVALPVASMADVILYGKVKGGVEVVKEKGVKGSETKIVDYGSRIGFKGHEHLTDSVQAIWQLEQSVNIGGGKDTRFGSRDSFIGLKGAFGTVKAGYQSTPMLNLNDKLDPWEYSSDYAGLGHFTRTNDANKRALALTYETPDFAGFSAQVFVSPSDNNGDSTRIDAKTGEKVATTEDKATYGLGVSFAQKNAEGMTEGFFADVAGVYAHRSRTISKKSGIKADPYQALAQVGYENDKFMVGAAYQRSSAVDNPDPKDIGTSVGKVNYDVVNEAILSGSINLSEALKLKSSLAYGWGINIAGKKAYGNGKYYQGIIGADYALSKRTVLNGQVGYLRMGTKQHQESPVRGGAVSVGMSHQF